MAAPARTRPRAESPATAPHAIAVATNRQWWADENNAVRRIGFPVGVLFVFLRFSFLHEILTTTLHLNFYLLLLIGAPATLIALAGGGLRRTFNSPAGKCWALFTLWMLLTVPFSTWISDSLSTALGFIRVTLSSMLVVAGLALTLKECFRMMSAIALASLLNVIYARSFAIEGAERLGMTFGSVANSNDFAAHLLLVLPFLLWVALSAEWKLIRIIASTIFIFGIFVGASNGSRGAMIAAFIVVLFAFARASGVARLGILFVATTLAIWLVIFMPDRIFERYATTFQEDEQADRSDEAVASGKTRMYLLISSLKLTALNPLFGVGPGQFINVEGGGTTRDGKKGVWQVTHNTYTQVSSEIGIPALIIFLAAIIVTFRIFNSIYRETRFEPQFRKVRNAAFCLMLSMVGYCTAIMFLSLAYSLYLPVMTGLAIALNRAFQREIASGQKSALSASLGRG